MNRHKRPKRVVKLGVFFAGAFFVGPVLVTSESLKDSAAVAAVVERVEAQAPTERVGNDVPLGAADVEQSTVQARPTSNRVQFRPIVPLSSRRPRPASPPAKPHRNRPNNQKQIP